ncbi:hypothetical protein MLD38_005375 [Melastoma candidum]|uniref:Uncharacterized protein n=1 Tax=Melastoma candidum TaxID=119954 RepID=A0ACB9S8N3_9MYRT|nr:hypothetical protein MLD38_005375 [Melastoma candidum]
MDEEGKIEQEKRDEDVVNRNSTHVWLNVPSTSANLVGVCNTETICREDFMGSGTSHSSAPMVDSFGRELWSRACDPPFENFGYCEASALNNSNISDPSGNRRIGPASFRSDGGWNPLPPMLKGGLYALNPPNMLPGSFCVPQFPTDSGFIERAARFSCFSGGNFGSLVNPFSIPENIGHYPVGPGPMDVFLSNCVKLGSELNVEAAEDVEMASKEGTSLGCTQENGEKDACIMMSRDAAEQGVGLSSNDSDEGESCGNRGGQANTPIANNAGGEGSSKEVGLRKRKRNNGKEAGGDKNKEAQGVGKNGGESQRKVEHPGSTSCKGTEKSDKRGAQAADPPKGDYIHIRARRGQATNSHSLAERVRREKISERMKLLQDLVPGCSKVTGKAVMLDEIINYVQSLQRQVEFLSMKLATVNPRIDSNIEGLLAKDMMMPRAGPSTLGFSPEMTAAYPQMHLLPPGLVPPDAVRRAIHGQTASSLPRARDHPQNLGRKGMKFKQEGKKKKKRKKRKTKKKKKKKKKKEGDSRD